MTVTDPLDLFQAAFVRTLIRASAPLNNMGFTSEQTSVGLFAQSLRSTHVLFYGFSYSPFLFPKGGSFVIANLI